MMPTVILAAVFGGTAILTIIIVLFGRSKGVGALRPRVTTLWRPRRERGGEYAEL